MSGDEIERMLRKVLTEASEVTKNPIETAAVRTLAASITLLVLAIDAQSKRIDALEYCKATSAPGMSHRWVDVGPEVRCHHCGTVRS